VCNASRYIARRPISISRRAIRLRCRAITLLRKIARETLRSYSRRTIVLPLYIFGEIFILLKKKKNCLIIAIRVSVRGDSIRHVNQFTFIARNYARHPMDRFRAALSSRIAVRGFLPSSPWLSRSLLSFLRHDDRHFRDPLLSAVVPALFRSLSPFLPPPLPPPSWGSSFSSEPARSPRRGSGGKNRVNRDSAPSSTRLRFPTFSPPAYVARRMQLQYNYPPPDSFLSRPLARRSLPHRCVVCFSRFRERTRFRSPVRNYNLRQERNRIRRTGGERERERERESGRRREMENNKRRVLVQSISISIDSLTDLFSRTESTLTAAIPAPLCFTSSRDCKWL